MGGRGAGGPRADAVLLMPDEVCHYAPYPDPAMRFRGMSWLTPVIREIKADNAATTHKDKFFSNGAVLSTVVKFEKDTAKEVFDAFVARFKAQHQGEENAYKTLFLGGGADVTIVGADMKQLEYAAVTAAGETRIAGAGGVHPVILGMSEGLNGSSLNEGNFGAARRMVADKTMRHLWGIASSSLQTLVKPPSDAASLWYDTRDVAFLREDLKDLSEIQSKQARTIRNLVDAGYTPDSVTAAVMNEDWSLLIHSGLYSVQLQKPGSGQATTDATPPEEG
jgi:phage portal protein BeeE